MKIAAKHLLANVNIQSLHVICPESDYQKTRVALPAEVFVHSEDAFIPGISVAQLRTYGGTIPPAEVGWYFQQLLKLQFAFFQPEIDYYLIWDADTIPLRPLHFFDEDGHMLLTKAREFHQAYFDSYRVMLKESPEREFSFIAQHLIVQKSVAREMLTRIGDTSASRDNWAWKIMTSFPKYGNNLFSEYEMYGHYIKNHYPERVRFIERPWTRKGAVYTSGWAPTEADLKKLARQYDYAAFERVNDTLLKVLLAKVKRLFSHHTSDDTVEDY